MNCTACSNYCNGRVHHPLLGVPICSKCLNNFNSTNFQKVNGKELFCTWCSDGTGELIFCGSCSKSFCTGCINRNFGRQELLYIKKLQQQWECYFCDPVKLSDACKANNWTLDASYNSKSCESKIVIKDISKGLENLEIPVINNFDSTLPDHLTYVSSYVCSNGYSITTNPENIPCCNCQDNCMDITTCACQQLTKNPSYDVKGRLLRSHQFGIYECNQCCSCHRNKCVNRVVGLGIKYPLEVFRCSEDKGWGVRCRTDIKSGTYVVDYMGEILPESCANDRGSSRGDEYLFDLDLFVDVDAVNSAKELSILPHDVGYHDHSTYAMDKNDLVKYLDSELVDKLISSGAVDRANSQAKYLKDDSKSSNESWMDRDLMIRSSNTKEAYPIFRDKIKKESEQKGEMLAIDAKWYGNIGRFINHSCSPNLDKIPVHCETRDKFMPRMSFFANVDIPAYTELCYDYGYTPGSVDGKMKVCICGSSNCRQLMY